VAAPALQDASIRFDDEAIRQVRVGRQPTATRVVLDLDGAPRVSVFALYNPFRVVIDTERVPGVGATSTLAPGLGGPGEMPAASPAAIVARLPAASSPAPPAVAPAPAVLVSPPEPPSANADGSFSIARQLGLGISRIVIDPGHGGHDPGTLTRGSSEAAIVLDVALRLERLLAKEPGLEVVLTRRTDVFIPLEQRTAIANREGADLFVSIHANASRNPKASGIETYYLSFASNPEAEAVAARENSTSARDMHNLPSIVRAIALNNKLDESRDLAGMLQDTLVTRLGRANAGAVSRGVKKAPFVVLIGAAMPSVLSEIGFLTNQAEAALVKTPAYRQRIAESLHAAILRYRRAVKQQSAVATR
jgi:N-acetylmuramoyl-L-alanine amidase